MICIFAESYAKGCKICSVKEKKLDTVFADESFPYPDNKEAFKNECLEYLKKKGLIYAVYFKKKLIGLYVLRCENLDLILVHQISYNMEDIVKAEVEKTIKLLVHMNVVNHVANRKYDKAIWNGEIIDRDYVKQDNNLVYFWIMILFLNCTVIALNIIKDGPWITTLLLSIAVVCYAVMVISLWIKKKRQ